jgi:hypothetical protein
VPPVDPQVQRTGRPPLDDGATELRECPNHGLTEHRLYGAGHGRRRWRCRRCAAEAVTRRHRKVRLQLVAAAGGRCAVCGYDRCLINLHFHHVDPTQKAFAMTLAAGKSLERYQAEARKCVLVCANCHGEIESGLIASPPAGAKYPQRDSNPC